MSKTWIISTQPQIASLLDIGRARGGEVVVVAVGADAASGRGAERVVRLDVAPGTPLEAVAPAVAEAIDPQPGDVVLAGSDAADRSIAGAVAARHHLPLLRGARSITADAAAVPRFGGIAEQTIALARPVLFMMDALGDSQGDAPEPEIAAVEGYAATVSGAEPSAARSVNLAAARRIVACGRGFKTEADLQLARELATAMDADLACSRPLAEGSDWFPRDQYVGVSGRHVTPDVYVALGISGQLQHTVGMKDSKVVVAVNTDPHAPIFRHADFGIVGDLYTVLPALTAALQR